MKTILPFCLAFLFSLTNNAQDYYYPPQDSDEWSTLSPDSLQWCSEKLTALHDFLDEKNSKSFIILKNGKIVLEYYFDEYVQDSIWYFASVSKSVMAFLMGMAQEEGYVDIDDPTTDYLGEQWTACPPEKEALITVRNQLTMTSGLDDGLPPTSEVPDPSNCLEPDCLEYLVDANERWAYHNAPYRLSQDVLEAATGLNKNIYTLTRLNNEIGMNGFWFNYIMFGTARDMARFGHLILSNAVWDGDTLLHDQVYLEQMLTPSQDLNLSYGYLWWLNGQDSYMLPQLQLVFDGPMAPAAPSDMVAALGKNDQKIYVVPSLDMVVVRQGEASGDSPLALSSFDNQLWEKLMDLECITTATEVALDAQIIKVFPNPTTDILNIKWPFDLSSSTIKITDQLGKSQVVVQTGSQQLSVAHLPTGLYTLQLGWEAEEWTTRFLKQ